MVCLPVVTVGVVFTALLILDLLNRHTEHLIFHFFSGIVVMLLLTLICEKIGAFAGWILLLIPVVFFFVGLSLLDKKKKPLPVIQRKETCDECNECIPCGCPRQRRQVRKPRDLEKEKKLKELNELNEINTTKGYDWVWPTLEWPTWYFPILHWRSRKTIKKEKKYERDKKKADLTGLPTSVTSLPSKLEDSGATPASTLLCPATTSSQRTAGLNFTLV